jgi:hypothetical protein
MRWRWVGLAANGGSLRTRDLPFEDVADYVRSKVSTAVWHYSARIRVHASAEYVIARMPVPITPEPIDDDTCVITVGSDTPHQLALWIGMLDVDFEVLDAPELAAAFRMLGDRDHRAPQRFQQG